MAFVPFLQAQANTPSTTGSFTSTILMMVALVAIFYFFLIRPQNKKQKETQKMLDALKKGDKVVTIGGIHGIVASVKDKVVVVKVGGDTKIEFSRSAIASLENTEAASEKDGKKKDKSEKIDGKDSEASIESSADAEKEGEGAAGDAESGTAEGSNE